MRLVGRVVGRLLQLLVTLVSLAIIALLVLGSITTQRGFAQTTGTISVAGLNHDVTVARDRAGIIQITADDRHDLFLAQGYVHAQERMWQMEVSRRIGAGRLSELFGKGSIDRDRYIRTLRWRVAAQRDLDAMSADSKAILQAYADGVNAWITEHDGRLSTPFVVAGLLSGSGGIGGYTLEPWTPLDTATWQKVQAWSLGGNVDTEIFRLLADARLGGGAAQTDELFPAYDATAPVITPGGALGEGGAGTTVPEGPSEGENDGEGEGEPSAPPASPAAAVPALTDANAAALADLGNQAGAIAALAGLDGGDGLVGSHGVGSNNWVVSGEHTQSGKPILANDPHLGFGMPSAWIMNGLHCRSIADSCPWDVVGVSFPGAPAVILGHNARIAWGATNVNPDTQDLFVEKVDPADANRYLYQGQSLPFEVRHETIKVGGGASVEMDIRSTRHGVLLSDVDARLKDGPVLAMRWTTTAEVDLALETFFKIDVAGSFDEFKAAFGGYGSPSQNWVYADVDGHIGYVLPGLIPIRAGQPTGERVRDGASGSNEWTGYIPRDQLPWQLDPVNGRIVSANNAAVDDSYPFWIGNEWDPGDRAARIAQRLDAVAGKLTTEDMRSIQMDTHIRRADRVIPALQSLGISPSTDDGKLLWSRILDWDRRCEVDSVGCTAYMTVELALLRAIFDDELGPLAREYVGSTASWEAFIDIVGNPSNPWWLVTTQGVGGSSGVGDPRGLAGAVIDQAAGELRKDRGDPAGWTWGALHTVRFKEATLGDSGILPLELYFDPAARPVGGADGAVQNNYYRVGPVYADPDDPEYVPLANNQTFAVTNGPSYRLTIDMADLDGARIIITTGQSGNAFETHYGDLIPLWAGGQTVPLAFSPANIKGSTVETLVLAAP
ncbi:MAG TPA: penicillin acylase family protein [Candidatus Limnocylindria bacterium]|nr:penicillin acylase family protein [Candidatus Limnocylindria bacterium]